MKQKLAELLFYSSAKPEEKWDTLDAKVQGKFLSLAEKSLEAIDKLGFALTAKLTAKELVLNLEPGKEKQDAIEKLIRTEVCKVTFFKAAAPKVSGDFWKELATKVNKI